MKGTVAILTGFLGGAAFILGWLIDPGANATLVTSLMCGFGSILVQLSSRDLISRTQGLIDRGADETTSDAGELFGEGRRMKARLESLVLVALFAAILAAFFASLRVIDAKSYWSAAALACAAISTFISLSLFAANRQLGGLIDSERVRRARNAAQLLSISSRQPFNEDDFKDQPNMHGYGRNKTGPSHPA
jgi:hypothetical protein